MKKIILVVSILFLFTNTAAGSNTFEGFPIVNVKVNGTLVQGDVPAVNLNGRTMVPVRFVSEALGADIKWDGNTNTVNVTSSTTSSTDEDIKTIKQLSQIAETCRKAAALGDVIRGLSQGLSLSYDNINLHNSLNQLNKENERLSEIREVYKWTSLEINNVIKQAETINEDISVLNNILNSYTMALDHYDKAIDNLYDFYNTNQETHFNRYLENDSQAFNIIIEGQAKSMQGYFYYFDKVQNY